MLLAALLRAVGLDGGLWWDEIRTLVFSVRQPLAQIVTVFPGSNQHTLYSVLAHFSIGILGEAAWSLRLPAVIFGVAAVPVLYFFAREFTGRREALFACLLLAVSYHHVWFSQNARGYTALEFFALLCSWMLLRGLRTGRTADFAGYAFAAALGAYAHLTMTFVVTGHAVACALLLGIPGFGAWSRQWKAAATGFLLFVVFTSALYSPLLFGLQESFAKPLDAGDVTTASWAANALLRGLQVGAGTALAALAGAILAAVGLLSYFRQSRFLFALFVLPGVITVAATAGLGRPLRPRFLFMLAGFALLVLVRGAQEVGEWLDRRWRAERSPAATSLPGLALVALMVAVSLASLPPNFRYPKQDFDGALQFVQTQRRDGDQVVTAGGAMYPYREYFRQPWEGVRSLPRLQDIRAEGRRVWVVYTLESYIEGPSPALMKALREDCRVAGVFRGTVAEGDVTVCVMMPVGAVIGTATAAVGDR